MIVQVWVKSVNITKTETAESIIPRFQRFCRSLRDSNRFYRNRNSNSHSCSQSRIFEIRRNRLETLRVSLKSHIISQNLGNIVLRVFSWLYVTIPKDLERFSANSVGLCIILYDFTWFQVSLPCRTGCFLRISRDSRGFCVILMNYKRFRIVLLTI